jgi:hypothetical protein
METAAMVAAAGMWFSPFDLACSTKVVQRTTLRGMMLMQYAIGYLYSFVSMTINKIAKDL